MGFNFQTLDALVCVGGIAPCRFEVVCDVERALVVVQAIVVAAAVADVVVQDAVEIEIVDRNVRGDWGRTNSDWNQGVRWVLLAVDHQHFAAVFVLETVL